MTWGNKLTLFDRISAIGARSSYRWEAAPTRPHVDWKIPTDIRFGAGRIAEVANACRQSGITRPLLVTDQTIIDLPQTATVLQRLLADELEPGHFSDIQPNPTGENLDAGVKAYRSGAHNGVIAFGGGSAIDIGKLIAFMAGQMRPVWEFENVGSLWKQADSESIAPVVAIPTAAGTGAEISRTAVLTRSDIYTKKTIYHPQLMPEIVICDPQLTVTTSKAITAGTGLAAFANCLEAYCSPQYHPISDGIAIEGMRLILDNLPNAFRNPMNIDARSAMMSAAVMGAMAAEKGLGAMNALSNPVSAIFDSHQGMTAASIMPHILVFNRPAIEEKIDALAEALCIPGGFDGFFEYLAGFANKLGVPRGLAHFGVSAEITECLADIALVDPAGANNPIPLNRDNIAALYHRSL